MKYSVTCPAPANSILVDTNKGIRPCCLYKGRFLGSLKKNKIIEIINNDSSKFLKQQMKDGVWPKGCSLCKYNEESFGSSLRQHYFKQTTEQDIIDENLTSIEFAGSNICNLSCVHCHSTYSSKWFNERKRIEKFLLKENETKQKIIKTFHILHNNNYNGEEMNATHLPNPQLVLNNLNSVDLTHLRSISFRGGEPLLNSETTTILQYLLDLNLLPKLNILMTTNCTHIDSKILELLNFAKGGTFNLSIDGIGELFEYIRYGDVKFEIVETIIDQLNTIKNVNLKISVSPMIYNVFNLIEIRDWSIEMSKKYKNLTPIPGFNNCVVDPLYLSLRTLSDYARNKLITYLSQNSIGNEFQYVINLLKQDFVGEKTHRQWVEYTNFLESIRGNCIKKIVPQLINELEI